jgi:subtilase family serine protease
MRQLTRPLSRRTAQRSGVAVLASAALLLQFVASGPTASAFAGDSPRVQLPDPTPASTTAPEPGETITPLDPTQVLPLRVYLTGQSGRTAAASAVSDPSSPAYAHYLTAKQFEQRFGPTGEQSSIVSRWLTSQGMKITASTSHYIAVNATVAQADAAFDTAISVYSYTVTVTVGGRPFPLTNSSVGTVGGFSVPASLGADVATVTGIEYVSPPASSSSAASSAATSAALSKAESIATSTVKPPAASSSSSAGYQCSQYWDQYSESIPAAYGRTTAPTQLCGYTVKQLRAAYGVSSSKDTGKGVTVAILSSGYSPTMLSDANRYFAGQGVPGFAPGQFTDSTNAAVTADDSCEYPLEESIDVESVHIAAPEAKVVNVAADCASDEVAANDPIQLQYQLDAADRVVDKQLADVVSGSYSFEEQWISPADVAAWNLTFEQGAIEGIGFDFSTGDGGAEISPPYQTTAVVGFPSTDPWATGVGGTSIAIGRGGGVVGDYAWGDNATEVDAAGTGYASAPPGAFLEGSGGGISTLFAEPSYQSSAVPGALATSGGTSSAHRVVPDISADAGSLFLIGYTGSVTPGVYDVVDQGGGTSASSPLIAGLEADAIQAAGHPLGFVNPALYQLRDNTTGRDGAALRYVAPVNPADPPVVFGAQPGIGENDDYLTTLGEDQAPLQETTGYDDVTGLGAPTNAFVTAFRSIGH